MSRKLLLTLLVSISAHVAAVMHFSQQENQSKMISMGSVKAPVSLTFSTVSNTAETKPQAEPMPEPEPVKEPEKPLPKPQVNSKPVLKKPKEKVEKKVKPAKKQPEVKQKKKEEKAEKAPEQVQLAKTAKAESKVDGLSDEPVLVSQPSIVNQVQPKYPSRYRRRNIEGEVKLELIVDENGQVTTVKILESSGYNLMDQSAMTAVRQWKFKPEQRDGRYVKSRLQLPVVFKIN